MSTTRVLSLPAIISSACFIGLVMLLPSGDGPAGELSGVESVLTGAATVLLCVTAGYVGRRFGASGMTCGSAVTGVQAFVWVVTGHLTPDVPPQLRTPTGLALVLLGALGGGVFGAIGGWLAGRRKSTELSAELGA